jgi:peptide chain release factor 1
LSALIQWDVLEKRQEELSALLADYSLDREKRQSSQKELNHLKELLAHHKEIEELQRELAQVKEQIAKTAEAEMVELFQEEAVELEQRIADRKQELDLVLAPPSEHDDRSVYLEIRAGTGGQEAALFAGDLLKMYTNYALKRGWRVSIESSSETDLGGFKEIVAHIKGHDVYGHLKRESGVHRVQRVPATETAGRVHTSTATVAVLPEAKDVDVSIDPSDLRIDVFRASGAGGQHVNTTDSAVRITHIPTGVVVSCQDERSQHKNKAKAMKILQSRILAAQEEKQMQEMSQQRKELVGTGMRAEKVRTYNYPQNRVTDHQVDLTLKKLDHVMEGDLDEILDALRGEEREERKKGFLKKFQ